MRTPTYQEIEGFFHGCEHIISMAQKHVHENPNARASSVLSMQMNELTTLALMAQHRAYPVSKPITEQPGTIRQAITFIGEFLGAASIFALIFLIPWIYYALTGELLDFGGGQ